MNDKMESGSRQIRSVTNLGIVTNVALCIIKVVIGLVAGSVSLVADGVHSLSDMATDLVVLLGVRLGAKEPDTKHPYGHGWIETYAGAVVALLLVVIGGGMIYYAAMEIAQGKKTTPRIAVLIAALVCVAAKELLYRLTRRVAVETHSSLIYANAWHHRSDALSSIAVVIGFVSLKAGFVYGDQIAAIVVGVMIVLVAGKIIGECLGEMTERAVDEETIEHIKSIISSNDKIREWHKLRSRAVGREVFVDFHILVDPELNVVAAHRISEELEQAFNEGFARPVNITVHIEPDIPEMRIGGRPDREAKKRI